MQKPRAQARKVPLELAARADVQVFELDEALAAGYTDVAVLDAAADEPPCPATAKFIAVHDFTPDQTRAPRPLT